MRAQRGDAVAPRDHVAHPQTGRGKDLRKRTDEYGVATRDEVGRRDRLPRERRERLVDHKARPWRQRGEDRTHLLGREPPSRRVVRIADEREGPRPRRQRRGEPLHRRHEGRRLGADLGRRAAAQRDEARVLPIGRPEHERSAGGPSDDEPEGLGRPRGEEDAPFLDAGVRREVPFGFARIEVGVGAVTGARNGVPYRLGGPARVRARAELEPATRRATVGRRDGHDRTQR